MDSLRSIAEGMFCTWTQGGERYEGTQREGFNHASDCLKHRLLALCDAAEKTDLVQKAKLGWMDSIAFDHELPHKPINEVYSSKTVCLSENRCIEKSESDPDEICPCHAIQVYVIRADELATWLAARGIQP